MYRYGTSIFIVEQSRVTMYAQRTKHIPTNTPDNSIALHPVWYNVLTTFSIQHYTSLLACHRRPPIYARYVASNLIARRQKLNLTAVQGCDFQVSWHRLCKSSFVMWSSPWYLFKFPQINCHNWKFFLHAACWDHYTWHQNGTNLVKSTNTNIVVRRCPVGCTPPLVRRQVKDLSRKKVRNRQCAFHMTQDWIGCLQS